MIVSVNLADSMGVHGSNQTVQNTQSGEVCIKLPEVFVPAVHPHQPGYAIVANDLVMEPLGCSVKIQVR